MNISAPFIRRPVATILLTLAIALSGALAFFMLPVAPLPEVQIPFVTVNAALPGASPETVANSVAQPLERHLGQIADVTEMTSKSSLGQTQIVMQFGLSRDINGAARDVQAAINAARADLPTALRQNPTYRKVNPAEAPILILSLTSKTLTRGQLYDAASNVLQQRISQLPGIGQVIIGGAALPAVRVELNPQALFKYGIGLEDVRAALASANANAPKGAIEQDKRHFQIYTNDQASHAEDYRPLVIAYRNGSPVRLSDVATIEDSVEDLRNAGFADGIPSVLAILFPEPGSNIIETVDAVKAELPYLQAALQGDIKLKTVIDRSSSIRASLHDTEITLLIAVTLVTMVVFLFLGNARATLAPSIAVVVSIVGTFGAMYLLGYSLNLLSLMALTISTGFVVDDAIVVVENIERHIEAGMPAREAALRGAKEVGFTVFSITMSLIAVFTPILFMGGLIGRFFREFSVTMAVAILISLVISLTTTPMLCALFMRRSHGVKRQHFLEETFDRIQRAYGRSLSWSLRHPPLIMGALFATIGLIFILLGAVPTVYKGVQKGLFPEEDTGRMMGTLEGDQSISFQSMKKKLAEMLSIVQADPAVETVVGFTGSGAGPGGATNSARVFAALKPLSQRDVSVNEVIARLRKKLSHVPGGRLYFQAFSDYKFTGRQSSSQYQYTLYADNTAELYEWAQKLTDALIRRGRLKDVVSDQKIKALESDLVIDRDAAARFGLTAAMIDNTLYDAFGQRQVSTIFAAINQYHVVMEIDPRYTQSPSMLDQIYISTAGGAANAVATSNLPSGTVSRQSEAGASASAAAGSASLDSARNSATNALAASGKSSASAGAAVSTIKETMIPLSAVSHYERGNAPLAINHEGPFVTTTISFNLDPKDSLSDAFAEIHAAEAEIHMPVSVHGGASGAALLFVGSVSAFPLLLLTAVLAMYIVLGILYESLIHPITILSTLFSAAVGALLSLAIFGIEFDVISGIGVILLIGLVKKNAIMMVDFAINAKRTRNASSRDAIYEACMLRLRPILMTSFAAMLGALPLALSFGEGGEMRRPLGVSIIGGLIVSQILTLYTTPVVYLYLDRFSIWLKSRRAALFRGREAPDKPAAGNV
ncbi:efflux RND transporter permease subunit [Rhodoblastus acidophilus]|uniref:Efflux RND transporter permease subunit n=1 Tax=Candidatus Rhodoblastus alkanivorans TaxID=2954117 RepID=A0ABS9Z735_9HYPH|nr:efflux RND transporter permease subunit [Candidatus Rhodoblastus alkanivorans]MCI4679698.1 efflux RND transporter permease subunit [Candidatus Rhodoblastus alkanivorans]MCI4683240.1 efflux RND transporter permease subunit [Candidatus Rhodoblastus alkanivorans]MDI4640552.1 efflux RND transporter permease subunit [Rhodoblastus acidophilus]